MISGLGAVMPHEKRDDDLDGMLSPRSEVESRERASSTGSGTGLVDPWAITDVRFLASNKSHSPFLHFPSTFVLALLAPPTTVRATCASALLLHVQPIVFLWDNRSPSCVVDQPSRTRDHRGMPCFRFAEFPSTLSQPRL
jgi:hypothetical protein